MTNQMNLQGTTISRRDFLKVLTAGLASTWALSASSTPLADWFSAPFSAAQTAFGSGLLRGTQSGQILQSLDQGQTWQLLASFGSHCAIQNLLTQNGQLFARLSVAGYAFWLSTPDAKTWHTVG